jgi:tight adherence protein B
MTLLTAVLGVVAVLLVLPPHAVRWDRMGGPPVTRRQRRRSAGAVLAGAALVVGTLGLGRWLDGTAGAVLAAAVLLVGGTVARLAVLARRRAAAARTARAVAEGCSVLAATLRVGQVPAQALATAAAGCAVLRPAHETLLLGGEVTSVWIRQAEQPGAGGLRELARAWRVAIRTGASLGSTLQQVAAGQSADQALRSVVGSELAAPRATGKLMAALPALGLAMGYLLGGDPVAWLLGGPAGWACTLSGTALACAGVLWIEALARAAASQG